MSGGAWVLRDARYAPAFRLLEGGRTWKEEVGRETMRYIGLLRAHNLKRLCIVTLPHGNWAEKGLVLAHSGEE